MSIKLSDTRHSIQPLGLDEDGVLRFKANPIVRHLLDHGGIDLNQLAVLPFDASDCEHFAQLIGYSHSGSGDLSYVSDETWYAAEKMYEQGISQVEASNQYLRELLGEVQQGLREPIAKLFRCHPDDVGEV